MPPWSLVSPASRGIGFALAKQILQTTNAPVVVTARKDLDKTKEELLHGTDISESRLTVLKLDVLDESTIEDAAAECKKKFTSPSPDPLQLSFIVPGLLFPEKSPSQINAADALLTFQTNTLGPMLMLKHFSPFLPKKNTPHIENAEDLRGHPETAVFAIMSARVGSITDNHLGGWYSYRASKAAVNQVVKTFDNYLRTRSGERAVSIGLHPGTVKTDFSREFWGGVKEGKLFEKEWVAERLVEVVRERGKEGRGRCWDFEGREVVP